MCLCVPARRYCFETLQRLHPGQRISQQSMGLLVGLLEGLTEQVVSKAHESARDKGVSQTRVRTRAGAPPRSSSKGSGCRAHMSRGACGCIRVAGVISSAEIQQAVRSILPPAVGDDGGATGERQAFRPFLPTAAKRARQLDKQTLKGLQRKTLKQRPTSSTALPPPNAPTPPPAYSLPADSKRV